MGVRMAGDNATVALQPATDRWRASPVALARRSMVAFVADREPAMDDDLAAMDRDRLVAEVRRLRAGIRAHRDSTGQDLCWHHPALWGLLPERTDPLPQVPEWAQFMRGCVRYRQSLDQQAPSAPRMTDDGD